LLLHHLFLFVVVVVQHVAVVCRSVVRRHCARVLYSYCNIMQIDTFCMRRFTFRSIPGARRQMTCERTSAFVEFMLLPRSYAATFRSRGSDMHHIVYRCTAFLFLSADSISWTVPDLQGRSHLSQPLRHPSVSLR
jgi:hypothetical protein